MEHWFRNDCGGITVTGRNEPSFEFSWVLAEDLQKLRAGSEGIQADGWGGKHAKQQVCCSLRCQTISFAWLQQTVRQWFHGCSSQQLGQLPALVGPAASAWGFLELHGGTEFVWVQLRVCLILGFFGLKRMGTNLHWLTVVLPTPSLMFLSWCGSLCMGCAQDQM